MKHTFVPLDVPSDADEIVERHKWHLITRVAPNPCIVLSFGGGHSARHPGTTLEEAYRSAYVDIALCELHDRKSDPRLNIVQRGFGTTITVELRLLNERFHCNWVDYDPARSHPEKIAVAVLNLYSAVDRQKRIVDAVTKRISQK